MAESWLKKEEAVILVGSTMKMLMATERERRSEVYRQKIHKIITFRYLEKKRREGITL